MAGNSVIDFLPSWYIKLAMPCVDMPDNEVMFHMPTHLSVQVTQASLDVGEFQSESDASWTG